MPNSLGLTMKTSRLQHVPVPLRRCSPTGCFGLTELGFGNNAVEMQTTAVYDPASQEFIIHTPGSLAQKYWITNGAVHAHWCAVFAQLTVQGVDQGIHVFLVRIRCDGAARGVASSDAGLRVHRGAAAKGGPSMHIAGVTGGLDRAGVWAH